MYYSEFITVNGKEFVLLHDDEVKLYAGIVSNEFEKIEYVTASELRLIADKLEGMDN